MRGLFERLFFDPKLYHYAIIILLTPLSLLYGLGMWLRRLLATRESFGIPIVSVGNLIVGGSGKTPFVIALGSKFPHSTIVSRGYGRQSSGLVEVSHLGAIVSTVEQSGDEAMLIAESLPKCSVIVSEDRKKAIRKAIEDGAKQIILDDGFNRVDIEKYEILLEPKIIKNILPFPAGPHREFSFSKHYANQVFVEGVDFKRVVTYEMLTLKMLLVTAISHPQRLDDYLPSGVVAKHYLVDHAYFDKVELLRLIEKYGVDSLLVTQKDAVKLSKFKLPLSIMKLELDIITEVNWREER